MEQTPTEIFKVLSRELRHLAELTATLQQKLSPRASEAPDVEAFQSLDCLSQTLDCLATYLARLGTAEPCRCALPIEAAADSVCLAALAARLRGGARANRKLGANEVELF